MYPDRLAPLFDSSKSACSRVKFVFVVKKCLPPARALWCHTLNRQLCMPNFAIFVKAELDGVASFSIPSDQCWVLDVKQVHHRPRLHWKFSTLPWQSLIPFSKLHGNSPPSL
jgi:hypothetical protein